MVEPTGYTALDIIGFTDKGPYDPTANYVKNDLVHVGNSTWRCKIDDTTGITPTEGANWTIFIESATSLAGMSDVDLNNPTDDDGLVYDATAQKWKNKQITTKEQWKKNGAYNLCPNTASTQSVGGVTITVNSNKTVTIGTGTTSSSIFFRTAANFTVDNTGTYKLVGSPTDIPASSRLYVFDESLGNTVIQDADGNGGTGTLTAGTLYGMAISIPASTVISQAITFKPMITSDLNATYADYVPYAKTNRQLTEDIKITTYTKTTDNTGECSIGSDSAYVPIGGSIVGTQNTHTGAVSFRTASSDRNSYYAMFYSATSSALNVVANKELTFIVVWVKKA